MKKSDNLDDLKQELDIDYHKITVEELYQRFSTHPDTVRYFIFYKTYLGNVRIFGEKVKKKEKKKEISTLRKDTDKVVSKSSQQIEALNSGSF